MRAKNFLPEPIEPMARLRNDVSSLSHKPFSKDLTQRHEGAKLEMTLW